MNDFAIEHCDKDTRIDSRTKEGITDIREKVGMGSALTRIREITSLDLIDSKILAIHVNEPGHCNRCNYDKLQGENQICPKCKSFNLNWE